MAEYDPQPGRQLAPPLNLSTAQREADEVDLQAGLSGVAGIVAGARGLFSVLSEVAEFAHQAIPGVSGVGVTLVDADDSSIETWAVTADFVEQIDKAQYLDVREGPCLTSMESRRPVVSGSLGSDGRWPHLGGRVARMGVHSALALPLIVGDQLIGAINAYAYDRDAFGDHAVELGTKFCVPAAISVYNGWVLDQAQQRTARLQHALGNRAVIDQAIGILRSRSGDNAEAAFERLTRLSQARNVKVYVLAQQLVDEAVRRAQARHKS